MKRHASSGSPYEAAIGLARAHRSGPVIAVAGTAPLAADGSTAHIGDLGGQTRRCLEIVKAAIEQVGGRLEDTVRTRIMLIDMSRWEEAARVHGEFFAHIKPACTFVEVSGFIKADWLVEVEADCWCEPSADEPVER